jgi:hypothetical protein
VFGWHTLGSKRVYTLRVVVGLTCALKTPGLLQDDIVATTEEIQFVAQYERECAFVSSLLAVTPSNVRWGDRVRRTY